ncbi:MAG: class I SAM-dependent methyltransferase [Melioribacteraceae bacterium]|nr:class I SAM-dependent methyltransferase [Melioribacteraceae bacterium]
MIDLNSIPKSENDQLLNKWGYDLLEEYYRFISSADFSPDNLILDIATGTGRAVSILSRMGYNVITGDSSFEIKHESEKRITEEHISKVRFIKLNLEKIPFPDKSIGNIVCLNTIHELENPITCLNEIVRVYSGKGKFVIADFNDKGYDVMDKLHTKRYGKLHRRGNISQKQLQNFIHEYYCNFTEINTKLNTGYIITD